MDSPLLQSKSRVPTHYIPAHTTQLHPRLNRTPFTNPNPNFNFNITIKNKLIIISISIFSLLFLLSASLRLRPSNPSFSPNGIVIYVSSKHTYMYVFNSLDPKSSSFRKVEKGVKNMKFEEILVKLIEFARELVVMSEREKKKMQIMVDENLAKKVEISDFLDVCRRVLRGSGFLFKDEWATILAGKQEAVYDWVAVNYALGNLGKEPQRTNGIVKLGGTSMQVAVSSLDPEFVPFSQIIKLAGVTYNLYTESRPYLDQYAISLDSIHNSKDLQTFSNFGEDIARSPCIPKEYKFKINASDEKVGIGNYSLCTSYVKDFLNRRQDKNCLQPPCETQPSSPIKLRGKPVPSDRFFFISEFFGWVPETSLSELESVGHHFCEENWYKLKLQYKYIDDLDLAKYCFSSAYVMVFLHDIIGISMTNKRIGFNKPEENIPPAWTYGAFVLQIMQEPPPPEMGRENTEEIVGNDVVTYISLFTVLLIAVLGAFFLLKYQKPQLKTVYDLQKGHYIVTRLPR